MYIYTYIYMHIGWPIECICLLFWRQMGHIIGNAISVPVMAGIMKGALDAMDM